MSSLVVASEIHRAAAWNRALLRAARRYAIWNRVIATATAVIGVLVTVLSSMPDMTGAGTLLKVAGLSGAMLGGVQHVWDLAALASACHKAAHQCLVVQYALMEEGDGALHTAIATLAEIEGSDTAIATVIADAESPPARQANRVKFDAVRPSSPTSTESTGSTGSATAAAVPILSATRTLRLYGSQPQLRRDFSSNDAMFMH